MKSHKFKYGDKVLVEFFNPLDGMKSVGKKRCLIDSYMEDFTSLKNDGKEYYKIFIDCDEKKPFFSSGDEMEMFES